MNLLGDTLWLLIGSVRDLKAVQGVPEIDNVDPDDYMSPRKKPKNEIPSIKEDVGTTRDDAWENL